ncbi:PTS sugar transporter subunit IIA [Vibrio mimicus]|uniref:Ascorbate-specific PTS system EIIA component n=1 Tax=Vibrio mimicus VM603 TaxID=671074 RepID=D2YC59_VIBMI|nr:PTS sugar transporter subunit IIA [Vibrio mimicus]EEW07696.1 Ascorbate-specific phosphotransferase enzyme IIA component [Vibrio mimicus VM603]
MITEKHVALNIATDSPQDAICQVGQLMVNNGLVEPSYIEGMLHIYEEFGPYWVLTHGLAMPHARPEDGAIESGFVIMTLEQPLNFGHEEHDPVSIVIGMSATDQNKHIENIQQLTQVLNNKQKINMIMQAKEYPEVIEIMNR